MCPELTGQQSHVLFISHGAGPLPLLEDADHEEMIDFLKNIAPTLGTPSAIVLISAHWEEDEVVVTSGKNPSLIYDYYGFPDEAYDIKYPAPGDPVLANKIFNLLQKNGIKARLDEQRGFDHGMFVPLKIMFPDAKIPCVQLSMVNSLDPNLHIEIGKSLSALREEKVLIIGSGFTFHNMSEFFSKNVDDSDAKNAAFGRWIIDTITDSNDLSLTERQTRLIEWSKAPFARYCHPREEHLLPLHVCFGVANSVANLVFDGKIVGKKTSAFKW